jgi:universal stress protein A
MLDPFQRNQVKSIAMKFQKILVPVDFSEYSLAAVQAAGSLAQQIGGALTLLYVQPPNVMTQGDMGPFVVPPLILPLDPEQREALQQELAGMRAKVPAGVPVDTVIEDGHPWPTICDYAKEQQAELIVIASHGYTGLKRMLLGSTAEQVVRHAECPVLVVKSFPG